MEKNRAGRPGVILYFEISPCLEELSLPDKGRLLEGILRYGEFGVEPAFSGKLKVAWALIRPRLDRDRERYETVCLNRQQAAQNRWDRYHREQAALLEELGEMPRSTSAYHSLQHVPDTKRNKNTNTTPPTRAKGNTPYPLGPALERELAFECRRQASLDLLSTYAQSQERKGEGADRA